MNLTILHSADKRILTKRFWLDGDTVQGSAYDHGFLFWHQDLESVDFFQFYDQVLPQLRKDPRTCIIRGKPRTGLEKIVQRTTANFPMPEKGCDWVMIDIDGLECPLGMLPFRREAIDFAIQRLPKMFHDTWCVAQFSASAGLVSPDGALYKSGIRVHLWFELSRGATNEEIKDILRGYPVDLALYNAVQPHYTADPILSKGLQFQGARRLFLVMGKHTKVELPPEPLLTPRANELGMSRQWQDPPGGLPSRADMLSCDFMRWFLTEPSIGEGRYLAARAFASNACRTQGDSEAFVRDGLNQNRPEGC